MKKHKKRARERKISFADSAITDHHFVNNRRETIFIDESLLMKGQLSQEFAIKIADLGNGCWVHHHF